ncbi:MAG: WG repeat-containing protein [Cyclobacteriaceae bacterium]|nr:WG repeat-containing protein [Cyclobacteriaceae bacterium]MDH4295427.1 WG repeat-containing protein [Cyclobacteriaceae bacterium]MDH5249656.1 WG repeat-containing protein [Cyclobacteriaceae bacterium]
MKRANGIFWLLLITSFSAANSYNVFEENGRAGLKDELGKILIPAQYEALGWSNGEFSILQNVIGYKMDGHWGLIHIDNQIVTKAEYEEIFPGDGTLIIARKKSNLSLRMVFGCLNTSGKEVIPFQYDGIKLYSFRAIVFTKIGNQYRYGLIDLENKTLIPQQYKNIQFIGSLRYAVESFENKTALFTENGKQVTNFSIDSISAFKKDYAIIYQNTQQGLMNRQGLIKAEPTFREIRINDDGSLHARQADEWLFLDGQNKLTQNTRADDVIPLAKDLLNIATAGFIEVEDYNLKPLFPYRFATLGKVIGGKAIFSINHRYGILRRNGSILLEAAFDTLYADQHFYVANRRYQGKDNWLVLDSLGNALSTKTYDRIYPFNGKIFPVVNRKFWGAIDTSGKEIITCTYDSILQQIDKNIVVKFQGQYGIINMYEEWKVIPRSSELKLITGERYIEITPRMTFLKSFDGNTIYFSENRVEINTSHIIEYLPSGTLWEIDLDGVIVNRQVQPEGLIEEIFTESEGLRAIRKNGQYGFVDSLGRLRIANRYDDVRSFREELAAIKILGKWGFINHSDNIAVQPVYEEVTAFHNGMSLVRQKGLQGIINKQGKLILPPRYESIKVLPDGNLLIQQNKLYGLADAAGTILIHPKYDALDDVGNNYVIVARDGKYGVISVAGISTIPLIYDFIRYDPFNDFFIALTKSKWMDLN